ncbi:hypothetical protein FF38_01535 [Lucilia cuprina]|uniref:Uncharacterized protein n=1 Tax=Lucilia cuprina TaxID=7375 RepID=A0A0L0CJ19_LUCCU|nr:hypothetical protein FF38_01535 [Lucilia cuprina]
MKNFIRAFIRSFFIRAFINKSTLSTSQHENTKGDFVESSPIRLRSMPFQLLELSAAAVIPYVPLGRRFCRHNAKRVLLGEVGCSSGDEACGESMSSVFSSGQLSEGEAIRSRIHESRNQNLRLGKGLTVNSLAEFKLSDDEELLATGWRLSKRLLGLLRVVTVTAGHGW